MTTPEKVIFGSKYSGYMLVLDTGGPRYIDKQWIPKMPFRGITFNNGIFDTTDPVLIEELRNHPRHGQDFWEVSKPADAAKVNLGRTIEVTGTVKSTTGVSTSRK